MNIRQWLILRSVRDIEDCYQHENFFVTYYTLYTIVYNSFYVPNTSFSQLKSVIVSSNWTLQKVSSNWFGPVFCGFLWFRTGFFWFYHIRQPVAVAVASQKGKKTGLDRTLKH